MVTKLHYEFLSEFKNLFYKDLLTIEHINPIEQHMKKLSFPNGDEDEEANLWGYIFHKNGEKFIIPSKKKDGSFINIKNKLPLIPKETEKVSYRGVVYTLVQSHASVKFRPIKKMTFKEFVDILSDLKHSNKTHQKLSWFIGLSHRMDRSNSRISTPPSFGKDSVVDIIGNLLGESATIVNPTIAKLEYMTSFKWLAINEVVDIPKAEWRQIEQFLLDTGAFKPEVAKHSRATNGVKEMLDLSNFSISLLYNDINNYNNKTDYFDMVAKDAVKDRFPAFRFYGKILEDFNEIKKVNVKQFVEDNISFYKDLIYTYSYFAENFYDELHGYTTSKIENLILNNKKIPERWKLNVNKILRVVDLYCDTQEEYDFWVDEFIKSLKDYQNMLKYPDLLEEAINKSKGKDFSEIMKNVNNKQLFSEKNEILLNCNKPSSKKIEDKSFWS